MFYENVSSDICMRCARCCDAIIQVEQGVKNEQFYETVASKGIFHDRGYVFANYGTCKHLVSENVNGEILHRCGVYRNGQPDICVEFSCTREAHKAGIRDNYFLRGFREAKARLQN
jgi:hypothetical protein